MGIGEWLALLPRILSIISALVSLYRSHVDRGLGRAEAAAEALAIAEQQIKAAMEAKAEADTAHAKDPTDNAFDRTFERRE